MFNLILCWDFGKKSEADFSSLTFSFSSTQVVLHSSSFLIYSSLASIYPPYSRIPLHLSPLLFSTIKINVKEHDWMDRFLKIGRMGRRRLQLSRDGMERRFGTFCNGSLFLLVTSNSPVLAQFSSRPTFSDLLCFYSTHSFAGCRYIARLITSQLCCHAPPALFFLYA